MLPAAWALPALLGVTLVALAGGVLWVLYPPLPRDLGGAPDLDGRARRVRIPIPGDGALDGWLLTGTEPGAVALFHGYGRRHHRMWRYASFLRGLGLHVLAVDFRSARGGERRPTTLGHFERRDAEAVLDWMLDAAELAGCRIGFLGESLGGSMALQVAALRPEVAAVVADGPFASSARAIEDACRTLLRAPGHRVADALRTLGVLLTGRDPGACEPLADAPLLANRPVLFIHGERDARLGPDHVRDLWRAAGAKDPLWIVPAAGHNEGWRRARAEYERRVSEFLAGHLLDRPMAATADGR